MSRSSRPAAIADAGTATDRIATHHGKLAAFLAVIEPAGVRARRE